MRRGIFVALTAWGTASCGLHPNLPFYSGNGDWALNTPTPAFKRIPHRQYFDKMHKGYYYYDVARKGYFWEKGTPKKNDGTHSLNRSRILNEFSNILH